MSQNLYPQAHATLDQAEEALELSGGGGPLPERQEWIQIQLARSYIFYWDNHPDQMDAIAQKIYPRIEADGRPDQHIELLSQQFMARLRHERYRLSDETVAIARRKLELVKATGVPYDIAWAQFQVGFGLLWHGEPLAAREWLATAYEGAVRLGARLVQARILAYLSVANRQLGDRERLREQSSLLIEMATALGDFNYQGISLANQGWLAWREGDLARAEQLCHSANDAWKQAGALMFHWLARWVLLAIAVFRHDLPQAEEHARALGNPTSQPLRAPIAAELDEALRACRAQDTARALQCFDQALEMAKATGDL